MSTMLRSADLRGDAGEELHVPATKRQVSAVQKAEQKLRELVAAKATEKQIAAAQRAIERAIESADRDAQRKRRRDEAEHEALVAAEESRRVEKRKAADSAEAALREHHQPTFTLRYRGKDVTVTLAHRDLAVRHVAVEAVRRLAQWAANDFQDFVQRARVAAPGPATPAGSPFASSSAGWIEKLTGNSSDLLPAARHALVSVAGDEPEASEPSAGPDREDD